MTTKATDGGVSKAEYRIVTDAHLGFEVQYRTPFWPFWRQCYGRLARANTHPSIESAEEFAREDAAKRTPQKVVRVLGKL